MLIASVWRGWARGTFIAGLLLGGLLATSIAVAVGSLVLRSWIPEGTTRRAVVGVVVVIAWARDAGVVRFKIPQNARQVPEAIALQGQRLGAFQFGVEMGTGMRTFMTSMLPHVVVAAALLLCSWPEGAFMGICFGFGRAIVPLARTFADNEDRWSDAFSKRERTIQVSLGLAVAVGGLLAGAFF
ncbi:hypothetical protein [Pimelobacter simplex]|uniref:hypothetical protein n=1 Tax=Nocardioides simplex TaxID=2045 RepID=UPI00214FCFEA|nr:hypothetical protein [Pimelobacter simplex]UUW92646.1 hypothetical protein M0M43_14520 [Pimelobacter simplex]UUW96473.1 hypothetical protein M0M48_03150 [Pimelobacter simplex]